MKISFVWDWEPEYYQSLTWNDGLAAALKELMERGHQIEVLAAGDSDNVIQRKDFNIEVYKNIPEHVANWNPEIILCWGDMTRPNAKPLKTLKKPMAICFAGGETNYYNTYEWDHIFVESKVYKEQLDKIDAAPTTIAFGTNTDLFKPIEQVKIFDTIFPATFADWKRHNIYAESTQGLKSVACGYMYDKGETPWKECIERGVTILPHLSAEALHYLYAASKVCVVTSRSGGGSQRVVLEAMAMNIPLIVTDSDKFDYINKDVYKCDPDPKEIRSYINAILDGDGDTNTRDYILDNWSHVKYADALEEELLKLL